MNRKKLLSEIIRKNLNLILEQTDKQIMEYVQSYFDSKTCAEIADDMETLKKLPFYQSLNKEYKDLYDDAIRGLNNPGVAVIMLKIKCAGSGKTANCKCIKTYLSDQFEERLKTNKDMVISFVCAFSTIFPSKIELNICKSNVTPEDVKNNKVDVKKDDKIDNKVEVKKDNKVEVKKDDKTDNKFNFPTPPDFEIDDKDEVDDDDDDVIGYPIKVISSDWDQ